MGSPFVIDTNVIVAGLLTAHADSPPARILDGMLRARFQFVVSGSLLAEYRAVLIRPKLTRMHGLSASGVDKVLTDMTLHATMLAVHHSSRTPRAPDTGDQFLWDLLAFRDDLVLVTGDKLLQQQGPFQQRVMSPHEMASLVPLL